MVNSSSGWDPRAGLRGGQHLPSITGNLHNPSPGPETPLPPNVNKPLPPVNKPLPPRPILKPSKPFVPPPRQEQPPRSENPTPQEHPQIPPSKSWGRGKTTGGSIPQIDEGAGGEEEGGDSNAVKR
jgi:hypothetical protein